MSGTVVNKFLRERINFKNRQRLKNKEVSLIANNCNGGFMCHDLHMQFRSPFVNLWLKPKDFLKYLKNIEHYMNSELTFIKEEGIDYPVGLLDDVKIYFMHYENEEIAREKWNERTKRIDFNNLFVLFNDGAGCTDEDLKEFDELPYKNKIAFVHKEKPEIASTYYIKGFENEESVGILSRYLNNHTGKRYYDDFDYVKWFNSGK